MYIEWPLRLKHVATTLALYPVGEEIFTFATGLLGELGLVIALLRASVSPAEEGCYDALLLQWH